MKRSCGILFHISSLPGPYGIGTFGREAYSFADFLKESGVSYWQVLPLGPTGYGDSPYQSFSSFALNPYFIDLEMLQEKGLLTREECDAAGLNGEDFVDFHLMYVNRFPLLRQAYARHSQLPAEEQAAMATFFAEQDASWLDDYALYMAVKARFNMREWDQWDENIRRREETALSKYRELLAEDVLFWKFIQFLAFSQWRLLKSYCNQLGISIIGDIPIYTATDSADTWSMASTGIFAYDSGLKVTEVAGCPPDFFSADGQYWGNPVYRWDEIRRQDYQWWILRLKHSLALYDWLRIDHFRGLSSYWSIPASAHSAADGSWVKGPGKDFLKAIQRGLGGKANIIAEDLGVITPDVRRLLKKSGFPGMKVMSFAFETDLSNEHLPCNYKPHTVAYIGTHDNDTIMGWLASAPAGQVSFARQYLQPESTPEYLLNQWDFIADILASQADTVVLQVQDLLGLPTAARMNTPSTLGGRNWRWRMKAGSLTPQLSQMLRKLLEQCERL